MESKYILVDAVPPAEDFCRLRILAGLTPCPLEAAKHALPRSCHGVYIEYSGLIVGMGRIIGDGALNFEIVDVAVAPEHQGKGLGWRIMEALMSWLGQQAPVGAYVTLIADVPELYEKFGFKCVRPESEGMALIWGSH